MNFPSIELLGGTNGGSVAIEYVLVATDSTECPVQLSDSRHIENKIDNGQEISDQGLIDFTAYVCVTFFRSCSMVLMNKTVQLSNITY